MREGTKLVNFQYGPEAQLNVHVLRQKILDRNTIMHEPLVGIQCGVFVTDLASHS